MKFKLGIYKILSSIKGNKTHLIANKNSKLFIEGFPRSGNTYFCAAFEFFNPTVVYAHHVHNIFQLKAAKYYKLRGAIVVRNPEDCIKSLIIRRSDKNFSQVIKNYINYHEFILKNIDSFFICEFNELIENPNNVFKSFNKYMKYEYFKEIDDGVNIKIKESIKQLSLNDKVSHEIGFALPSTSKELKKKQIQLDKSLLDEAIKIHSNIIKTINK